MLPLSPMQKTLIVAYLLFLIKPSTDKSISLIAEHTRMLRNLGFSVACILCSLISYKFEIKYSSKC